MFRYIKLLIAAIWFCTVNNVNAQQHYNSWFRLSVGRTIREHVDIDVELQHRRQNGFGNQYPLSNDLLSSFRSWIHYRYSPSLTFSVSPFAYFAHNKIILHDSDETSETRCEIRLSAASDLHYKLRSKFYLLNRAAAEYRIRGNEPDILRLRNKTGIRWDFAKKVKLQVFDELFVNASGVAASHFFDQNRIGGSVTFDLLPDVSAELGYLRIARMPVNTVALLYDNNFLLNVSYQFK
jgi:Protein of unknown function (DUF2490).